MRCCVSKTLICQCSFVCPPSGASGLNYDIISFFPYILSHVTCSGSENHLINCSHRVNVECSSVAEAFCAGIYIYCTITCHAGEDIQLLMPMLNMNPIYNSTTKKFWLCRKYNYISLYQTLLTDAMRQELPD